MSVFNYKKYRILLEADSNKVQGLHVGDIVRRQYFDGRNVIYSLMNVLEIGTDADGRNYFVGALLEGDIPEQGQLLDFARITNLFDEDRSGALYLTASDSNAPYMDVIDGIAKNQSLCWPVGVEIPDNSDPERQYILEDATIASTSYSKWLDGNNRVFTIKKNNVSGTVALKQDFYRFIQNPNCVLISYKIRASRNLVADGALQYVDGVRIDGTYRENITTDWEYKFHAIVVDWSGRHLRTFKLAFNELEAGDSIDIADLNIILLSSVSNFGEGSQIRVGRLDGVVDPIFGRLSGYGSYLQKLFTSGSAHISGTLTAGDENGFGSSFYAGKIHRNVHINSLSPALYGKVEVTEDESPTGIGNVYKSTGQTTLIVQEASWLQKRIGEKFCYSFWAFAYNPCQISVLQNGISVGSIQIETGETHSWKRHSVTFELVSPPSSSDTLKIVLTPAFSAAINNQISPNSSIISKDTLVEYKDEILISSPQLEKGSFVSQYQPTDEVINETNDYGAWFNRGGIGGTIQNPLLQLNYDGQGGIGTRTRSFLLKADGSGYLANKNIEWDEEGHVTFGEHVTLNWDNLSDQTQKEISSKSVKLAGNDTILVIRGNGEDIDSYNPTQLHLEVQCFGFQENEALFQWQYKVNSSWINIDGANSKRIDIDAVSSLWEANNDNINIRCQVKVWGTTLSDAMTLKKMVVTGYTVEITSTSGISFHNGSCQTILKANVYYRGTLLTDVSSFIFHWQKYTLPDTETEDEAWWNEQLDDEGNVIRESIDRSASQIVLNYEIGSQDYFTCTVSTTDAFPYNFPLSF